jgi:hypothetical protein
LDTFLDIERIDGRLSDAMRRSVERAHAVVFVCTPRFRARVVQGDTNVAFEFKTVLARTGCAATDNDSDADGDVEEGGGDTGVLVRPILVAGSFDDAVPPDLKEFLVRTFRDPSQYDDFLASLLPRGLLPSILGVRLGGGTEDEVADSSALQKALAQFRSVKATRMPPRARGFCARSETMARLEQRFDTDVGTRGYVVLSGVGGSGKTALAAEFAHARRNSYDLVRVIDASSADALHRELAALLMVFGMDPQAFAAASGEGKREAALRERANTALEEHADRWLLVFDNADGARTRAPSRPCCPLPCSMPCSMPQTAAQRRPARAARASGTPLSRHGAVSRGIRNGSCVSTR